MKVSITVGDTTRETTLQQLLEHPQMERDPQAAITMGVMSVFEAALSDEWSKASRQINEVCDFMGWGYTR
jgi:hypothetical protein